jgi:hypothetical protein
VTDEQAPFFSRYPSCRMGNPFTLMDLMYLSENPNFPFIMAKWEQTLGVCCLTFCGKDGENCLILNDIERAQEELIPCFISALAKNENE